MTAVKLGMIALFGTSLALTGCGYSCASFCADGAECGDNDPNPYRETDPEDCDALCELTENRAERMGCDEKLDDVFACLGDLENVCEESDLDDCQDENEAFSDCTTNFCEDNPNDDDC
jgi:hypothetical protein